MSNIRHTLRFPSYRNLQIYHALACQSWTQTALAEELGISQRRVSQIGQQVRAWVDRILKPREFAGQEGLRFHLAIARERIRLRDAYEPLVEMFAGPDGFPRLLRRRLSVVGGEALQTVEVSDQPDFRLLNQAIDVASRQTQLEAIANRGPFADLPSQVRRTIVHQHAGSAQESACNADAAHEMNPLTGCQQNHGGGVLPVNSPAP